MNSINILKKKFFNSNIRNFLSKFNVDLNRRQFCVKEKQENKSNIENLSKTSTENDSILFNNHNPYTLEIQINQPKKLNSLDYSMIKSMLKRVQEWVPENIDSSSDDENVKEAKLSNIPKVIMFTGNGKAFCAGGDITSLYKQKTIKDGLKMNRDFFRYEYLLDYSISKMKPIQMSFWHGAVMGGGCGISVNSPFRIATDTTVFAMPETAIGLFPDVGATWFLPRIFNNKPKTGLYVGLSGDRIKGQELAKVGFATHYANLENFEKLKKELIKNINKDTTYQQVSDICNSICDFTYTPEKYHYDKQEMIDKVFDFDSLKDILERLQKLSIDGNDKEKKWANTTLTNFRKFSPTSMVISFEQIKKGLTIKSIEEAFNIESQLVNVFIENNDFYEGVRAMLIEKDNNPKWEYKSIEEINQKELIQKYFESKRKVELSDSDDDK